jgi:hypothetical protein
MLAAAKRSSSRQALGAPLRNVQSVMTARDQQRGAVCCESIRRRRLIRHRQANRMAPSGLASLALLNRPITDPAQRVAAPRQDGAAAIRVNSVWPVPARSLQCGGHLPENGDAAVLTLAELPTALATIRAIAFPGQHRALRGRLTRSSR